MKTITLTDISRRTGISETTIRSIRHQLPGAVRIGTRVRYLEDEVIAFLKNGGTAAPTPKA